MNRLISLLREIRIKKGWSQAKLSKRLNLPQSHISKIESGKIDIRLSSLTEISAALEYQLVLVPKHLSSQIDAIILGKDLSQPKWQPDLNEKGDEDE